MDSRGLPRPDRSDDRHARESLDAYRRAARRSSCRSPSHVTKLPGFRGSVARPSPSPMPRPIADAHGYPGPRRPRPAPHRRLLRHGHARGLRAEQLRRADAVPPLLRQLADDLYAALGRRRPVLDASRGQRRHGTDPPRRSTPKLSPPSTRAARRDRSTVPRRPSELRRRRSSSSGFPAAARRGCSGCCSRTRSWRAPTARRACSPAFVDVLGNDALGELAGRARSSPPCAASRTGCARAGRANTRPMRHALVEKTPSNVDHLDTIVELFPDASIIGIYRDGRDVVHSLMQVQFGTDDRRRPRRRRGRRRCAKLRSFAAVSDRIRIVRYEDMSGAPVAHVVELLDWLGLPAGDDVQAILAEQAGTQVSQHRVRGATCRRRGSTRRIPLRRRPRSSTSGTQRPRSCARSSGVPATPWTYCGVAPVGSSCGTGDATRRFNRRNGCSTSTHDSDDGDGHARAPSPPARRGCRWPSRPVDRDAQRQACHRYRP